MNNHLATLDLETISTAEEVILTALQRQVTQWEQDAQDAIAEGQLAPLMAHKAANPPMHSSTSRSISAPSNLSSPNSHSQKR